MHRRLTSEDYLTLATNHGIIWLGVELPKNNGVKTLWRCSKGHEFLMAYNSILGGHNCPVCGRIKAGNSRRLKNNDYHTLAQAHGLHFIGIAPRSARDKTDWKCQQGHVFATPYNRIQQGGGCPVCGRIKCQGNRQFKEAHYHELAKSIGYLWAGQSISSAWEHTLWTCDKGHTFQSTYAAIRSGLRCQICAPMGQRIREKSQLKEADYHALTTTRGIRWIGVSLPNNNRTRTEWQCDKGHQWETTYGSIHHGTGCPICANVRIQQKLQLKPEAYHAMAQSIGYSWVGELPPNNSVKTAWQCDKNHVFDSAYGSIQAGSRCPTCYGAVNGSKVSIPQRAVHKLIGGELNYKFGRYCIDVALDPNSLFRIAVEYDCYYWHDAVTDAKRDARLLAQGWRILRIRSGSLIPPLSDLQDAIERLRAGETYLEIVLPDWGD